MLFDIEQGPGFYHLIYRRNVAMQEGLKTAISVPLKVMNLANECWDAMVKMAAVGNIATISDMQVSFIFKCFVQN